MPLFKKKEDQRIAAYQRELIETHYAEVENMYKQIRGWRHDYRNHIQTLKAYAASGNMDAIKTYLDELDTDLATVDTVIKTGNAMADAILNSKISLAHSKDIPVHADAHIPLALTTPDIDLCVIIGNLFDNAIEASLKLPPDQRMIRIYMDMKNTQLYISFTNLTAEKKMQKSGRIFHSTKGEGHGLGLVRIDAVIDRLGGYLSRNSERSNSSPRKNDSSPGMPGGESFCYTVQRREAWNMSEKKTKPKYSSVENVGWMIANAWRECRSVLLICVIIAVVSVALNLTELFIAPQILQRVENGAEVSSLLLTIVIFSGALFLLMGLKRYFEDNSLYGRIAVRTAIIVKINEKTNTTSYPNMLDSKIQKLRSKAYDATSGNSEASEHIWTTVTTLLTNLIGFVVYLTLLSNLSGLLMLVVMRYRHREEEAEYDKRFLYIRNKSESVELAKDIRVFGLAPWLQSIYNSILKLYEGFVKKSEKQKLIGNIVDVLLGVLRNGIAYFYLINMALNENLPASTFLLYFTAVSGFTAWITGILNEFAVLHKESLDLNTIREYLDVPEPFRFEGGVPIPDLSSGCEIKLEKVSFRYPDAEKDTIHDLDLTIAPGEKLAIVGLNGAGKTTLVKLICGLLDPTTGCVLLNGIDIRRFNRQAYYDIFSTVFQDFSVLDISVAENVAQRIDGIDRERVDNCLALAGLTEKISELPNGVDTKIGRKIWDDGVELSGGQIQRLMLARALYRDAPMLLLDEPTAALDPLAENDIYVKYNEMTHGKTSLFVSHRLASTRFCDRIIFVSDGHISEEGTHADLLERGGEYANLYEVQSRYYQEGRDF